MKAHHHPTKIMGCGFVITAVHEDPQVAWDAIRAAEDEMKRIENLISSWQEESQTSAINRAAGTEAIEVCDELYALIARSQKISQLTCGAFDLSGTLARYYWVFDKQNHTWLDEAEISKLSGLIEYRNIVMDEDAKTVFLKEEGMKIGFGGIGKGYAAQQAKQVMQAVGIEDGLINASGDLLCWGNPPKASSWNIKIPDPRDRQVELLKIGIDEGSVVTSGSFENYTLIDEVRYSHIINPRTGVPVTHTKNVSVICPDAEFGDAMATALSVLPIEEGLGLVNQMNGIECIIIDAQDQIHFSHQLKTIANV